MVLLGTLDTKGAEIGFLRDRLRAAGVGTLLVDVGILEPPAIEPDVSRVEVAAATGLKIATAVRERERGEVVAAMADAAAATVRRLHAEGRCDGILAAGGGTNTMIALTAMRALPFGLPKLIVSTQAGGASAGFLDFGDVVMVPSIADVAGLNSILVPILINAAGAMAGMVGTRRPDLVVPAFSGRRIATSMSSNARSLIPRKSLPRCSA